jgi:hypothetical protein
MRQHYHKEGAHAVEWNIAANKFIAKFRVQDLVNVPTGNAVKFTVRGLLADGTPFEGSDTIRVISQGSGGSSGGGSTGGGGGGSIGSGEDFINIEIKEKIDKYIYKNILTHMFSKTRGSLIVNRY